MTKKQTILFAIAVSFFSYVLGHNSGFKMGYQLGQQLAVTEKSEGASCVYKK